MSSCCQNDESIRKEFAQVLIYPIVESTVPVLVFDAFYLENDKWPSSKEELADFCFQNKWDDYGNFWKSCEYFNTKELDDGSLEITYKNTIHPSNGGSATYTISTKIPKPSGDKKAVREELDRLLMKKEENINKLLQETR
ncbi:MAG: hypothetical protein A2167_00680 [Planctomycetes bacterium RBG_13_46_10]|nr:MAG: hypothetical protein A2167_00680 [Planctomycetes bacterium RBG_13_46_10]